MKKCKLLSHIWLSATWWICSSPGSSVHGICQARILKWVAIPCSRRSSQLRGQNWVSCISRWIFYCLSHQVSLGFSSSHIWVQELDHKEGWTPKNLCFQTVMLEKTLESPLDCKKIKPVNHKINQSWIFIGGTDAEAPILWQPDVKRTLWFHPKQMFSFL